MRQISAAQDLMNEILCSCMQRQKGLRSECNVIAAEQPAGRLYFGPEARVSTRKAALLIRGHPALTDRQFFYAHYAGKRAETG